MDIIIKDMSEINEDGFTFNILYEFNGKEVWVTQPANNVSLNDCSQIHYASYNNEEFLDTVEGIRLEYESLGILEAEYIHQNHRKWLQQLSVIMSEEEMKEYFDSFTEEVEGDKYWNS